MFNESLGEAIGRTEYLQDFGLEHLKQQSKLDFINECDPHDVAVWVMYCHLEMFCREHGYAYWKRQKNKVLRKRLMEEL